MQTKETAETGPGALAVIAIGSAFGYAYALRASGKRNSLRPPAADYGRQEMENGKWKMESGKF